MTYVAVIGASAPEPDVAALAEEVGRVVAERGATLVTGGLGGVMEAASRGAKAAGGRTLGILPGLDRAEANAYVDVAVATGLGELRNGLVVRAADAVVAVGGAWGTLAEIAFALQAGKPVAGLASWELAQGGAMVEGVQPAESPRHAVELVLGPI